MRSDTLIKHNPNETRPDAPGRRKDKAMRIKNNSIITSFGAIALAFGMTACLEGDNMPEMPKDQVAMQDAEAPAAQEAAQDEVMPEAQAPVEEKEAPVVEEEKQEADDAKSEAPAEEKAPEAEALIEPEVKASIPDVLTADDATRLEAQYEEILEACTEIRTVCTDDGNDEAKCVEIETGCKQAAESVRSGASTRAGLLSVLKSLVEGVLGVGDAAVSLVRCVSRLIGCAFTTLSLHCAADLVECVVEEVIAK